MICNALKFSFAVGLIAWMIINGMLDLSSLSVLAKPEYLIIFIVLVFLNLGINNARWNCLLKMNDFHLSNMQTFQLTLIGVFFKFVLPGGVGGDVVKGYYLVNGSSGRKTIAATTLLMDRLIGMYGMVLVSVVIVLTRFSKIRDQPGLHLLSAVVVSLFFLISVFFAMAFSTSIKNHPFVESVCRNIPGGALIKRIYDAIHSYRSNPKVLLQTLILSFISQFTIILFFWFFAQISGAPNVSFSVYIFVVPLGLLSTALPVSVAGIGIGQAALYYLYKLYTGIDSQIGPNAFTAYQIILLCWGLLGAYLYVTRKTAFKQCVHLDNKMK